MEEQVQNPFAAEVEKLAEVQQKVLETIQSDQGLFNMGRQAMDNLNLTYLLIQSLGMYMLQRDQMVDQEVEKGNVTTFPGAAPDGTQEADA